MGLITGQFFGDISGKVGGSIFSRNSSGKQLKAYVYLKQAGSESQLLQRSKFSEALDEWRTLTPLERSEWSGYAKYYSFKSGTYQFFMKCKLTGFDPMPSVPYSIFFTKELKVSQLSSIVENPIEILPALGPLKFYRILTVFCYIPNDNFSVGDANLFINNTESPLEFWGSNAGINYFCYSCSINFNKSSADTDMVNHNIKVIGNTNFVDLGSSSSVFITIEYRIIDFSNIK